jgi:hypothetical protein
VTPVRHAECNETYFERGARRWGPGTVAPLPIQRTHEAGRPCFVTHWRPSQLELAQLAAGGSVMLRVFGDCHPVVNVETA